MNWTRLLRLYTMIAAVSTVSLFVFATQFQDELLSILVVAVGTVALVSAIMGVLLSADRFLADTESERGTAIRE